MRVGSTSVGSAPPRVRVALITSEISDWDASSRLTHDHGQGRVVGEGESGSTMGSTRVYMFKLLVAVDALDA